MSNTSLLSSSYHKSSVDNKESSSKLAQSKLFKILPKLNIQRIASPMKNNSKPEGICSISIEQRPFIGEGIPASFRLEQKKYRKSIENHVIKQGHSMTSRATISNEHDKKDSNKKTRLWEALIELKLLSGRYEKNAEVIIPFKNDLSKAISSLTYLANDNSQFQEQMKFILKILNMSIYFNPKILKIYGDINDQNDLLKILSEVDIETKHPYYTVFLNLLDEYNKIKNVLCMNTQDYRANLKLMQDKINDQETMIKRFQLNMSKTNLLNDDKDILLNEIEDLKEENKRLNEENIRMNQEITKLTKNLMTSQEKLIIQDTTLSEKNEIIDTMSDEKIKLMKELDHQQENYVKLKEKMQALKDMLDMLIIKLSNIKNELITLRQQNEELKFQHVKLSMRAAVGYENLTPRPDYNTLLKQKNIELFSNNNNNKKNKESKKNKELTMSTIQFFDAILTKYVELVNQYKQIENNDAKISSPYYKDPSSKRSSIMRNSQIRGINNELNSLSMIPENRKLSKFSFLGRQSTMLSEKVEIEEDNNSNKNLTDSNLNSKLIITNESMDKDLMTKNEESKVITTSQMNQPVQLDIIPQDDQSIFGKPTFEKIDSLMVEIIETKNFIDDTHKQVSKMEAFIYDLTYSQHVIKSASIQTPKINKQEQD